MYETQQNAIATAPTSPLVGTVTKTREYDVGESQPWTGVDADAYALAASAKLSLDVYSLARCLRSEYGSHQPQYLLAAAECVRNSARRGFGTGEGAIYAKLTYEKKERRLKVKGKFGEQHGRFASTRLDPAPRHVLAAGIVLGTPGTDLMLGATSWFEPSVQDQGAQGKRKLQYDAEGIVKKWGGEGMQWIGPVAGINPYVCMAFKHAEGAVDLRPALLAIEEGRKGRAVEPPPQTPDDPPPERSYAVPILIGAGVVTAGIVTAVLLRKKAA